jgi:hypothetical protein
MLTSTVSNRSIQELEHHSPRYGQLCDLRERTELILQTEVDFIPNASFVQCDHESEDSILLASAPFGDSDELVEYPGELPAHLARLCEARLLTAEENGICFER